MKVTIQLDTEEIRALCSHLCSELESDMPIPASEDMDATLKNWREHSPHYVAYQEAAETRQNAQRKAIGYEMPFDRELNEGTREMHDATADLLEKLLAHLPAEEPAEA